MASLSKKERCLYHWHDLAQPWMDRSPANKAPDPVQRAQTDQAYSQLLFAFGLARAHDVRGATNFLAQASRSLLSTSEEVHCLTTEAFHWRIEQALQGQPHRGQLPEEFRQRLDQCPKLTRYCVDRLRQDLNVLEPDDVVDPYQLWVFPNSARNRFEEQILRIPAQSSSDAIQHQFSLTSRLALQEPNPTQARSRLLSTTLSLLSRLEERFAVQVLAEAVLHLEKLALTAAREDWALGTCLFELAWTSLGRIGNPDLLDRILPAFHAWMTLSLGELGSEPVSSMLLACFRSLAQMGHLESLETCAREATRNLLYDGGSGDGTYCSMQLPLALAEGWLTVGRPDRAWAFLSTTRDLLLVGSRSGTKNRSRDRLRLAVQYVLALRRASLDELNERLEELFCQMKVPHSTSSVEVYCSLWALRLLDAVVMSAVDVEPPFYHVVTSA